jgi:hypothetical protein
LIFTRAQSLLLILISAMSKNMFQQK